MSKIQCITSFIDIGRGNWSNYNRTNDKYIENFLNFYSNIDLDLILFCNESFKEEINKKIFERYTSLKNEFRTKINFQHIEKKDLNYFKIVDLVDSVQKSANMISYKKRDQSNPPEYSNPEYVVMMFAKTEFIKISLDRGLITSNNIAWIDFGIGHSDSSFIESIKNKKMINPNSDKIILFNRQNIEPSTNPFFYSSMVDNVLICGGFYIVPTTLINFFYDNFNNIVNSFIMKEIIDDDQTILSIFAALHNEKCNVINSSKYRGNPSCGDWFPVFEFIK